MKLFIKNQSNFIGSFPVGGNSVYKSHREIHKDAFNTLRNSVAEGNIPLVLLPEYKPDGMVILEFVAKKDDIYFYEFNSTVS